ncbi:Putative peptidoglycan binding domain-containing protein [Clostridium sp. USBA 49]|jgi:hypothetical protein|uniref:peptidoglycan-binding domain-containing protein n=1 Tax=Clostridium sp. USBA 49 TaxID=1881060 RepID=UPI0009995D63|nr:peptidoglycan-binding domain-containing protein [Clostridium sp. USBA 49]SKA86896.1 Putative peptidoglycan binding domain-containing protein [Clostridium sp. USBA 49]
MRKIGVTLTSFCMVFLLTFGVQNHVLAAASMQDDWTYSSWIGWNYTTKGGIVFAAQKILNSAGMSLKVPGFTVSDGYYGENTAAATRQYQRDYGLLADGVIGNGTWSSFEEHKYYAGNLGSIQRWNVNYRSDWSTVYFERDYINGWCVYAESTGKFYLCNDVRYKERTLIPL